MYKPNNLEFFKKRDSISDKELKNYYKVQKAKLLSGVCKRFQDSFNQLMMYKKGTKVTVSDITHYADEIIDSYACSDLDRLVTDYADVIRNPETAKRDSYKLYLKYGKPNKDNEEEENKMNKDFSNTKWEYQQQ